MCCCTRMVYLPCATRFPFLHTTGSTYCLSAHAIRPATKQRGLETSANCTLIIVLPTAVCRRSIVLPNVFTVWFSVWYVFVVLALQLKSCLHACTMSCIVSNRPAASVGCMKITTNFVPQSVFDYDTVRRVALLRSILRIRIDKSDDVR